MVYAMFPIYFANEKKNENDKKKNLNDYVDFVVNVNEIDEYRYWKRLDCFRPVLLVLFHPRLLMYLCINSVENIEC